MPGWEAEHVTARAKNCLLRAKDKKAAKKSPDDAHGRFVERLQDIMSEARCSAHPDRCLSGDPRIAVFFQIPTPKTAGQSLTRSRMPRRCWTSRTAR